MSAGDRAREMRDEQKAADAVNAVKRWRIRHAWVDAIRYADVYVEAATAEEAIAEAAAAVEDDPFGYDHSETYDGSAGATFVDGIEDMDAGEDDPNASPDVPIDQREAAKSYAEHFTKVIVCQQHDRPRTISLVAAMIEFGGPIERQGLAIEMMKRLAAGEYFLFSRPEPYVPPFWICMPGTVPEARDFNHGVDIAADQEAY